MLSDDDATASSAESELRAQVRGEQVLGELDNAHSDARPSKPVRCASGSAGSVSDMSSGGEELRGILTPTGARAAAVGNGALRPEAEDAENVKPRRNRVRGEKKGKKGRKEPLSLGMGAGFMSPTLLKGNAKEGFPRGMTAGQAGRVEGLMSPASRANKGVLASILG
jgi:hypothetical protein